MVRDVHRREDKLNEVYVLLDDDVNTEMLLYDIAERWGGKVTQTRTKNNQVGLTFRFDNAAGASFAVNAFKSINDFAG